MTDTFRIEARDDASDEDYIAAIECKSEEECVEVLKQWRVLYPHVARVDVDAAPELDTRKEVL